MTPAEVEGYMHPSTSAPSFPPPCTRPIPATTCSSCGSPQAPSQVRKLLSANTNVEGWAHYSEQMMLDEGYGQPGVGAKDEREAEFLRLGQLQDALLRNARFIVGIEMHTGKMTSIRPSNSSRRKVINPRKPPWWKPSAAPAIPLISTTRWASLRS